MMSFHDLGPLPKGAAELASSPAWHILPSGLPFLVCHKVDELSLESLWNDGDWTWLAVFVRVEEAKRPPQEGGMSGCRCGPCDGAGRWLKEEAFLESRVQGVIEGHRHIYSWLLRHSAFLYITTGSMWVFAAKLPTKFFKDVATVVRLCLSARLSYFAKAASAKGICSGREESGSTSMKDMAPIS